MKKGALLALIFFTICRAAAQDSIQISSMKIPGFIPVEKDSILNSAVLSSFFEKLSNIKKQKKQVNILHIGDSHIQADFLTNTVRQLFQKDFGNAGRGLVFPGRMARTNEPMNIRSATTSVWESKRIVFTDNPLPVGIGAATLQTQQDNASFSLRLRNNPSLNYSFSELTVFFEKDSTSYNLIVKDSTHRHVAYVGAFADDHEKNFTKIHLPFPVNYLEFETQRSAFYQKHFTLLGISSTNHQPGVVYHSIGGNGAKFKHYLSAKYFFEQTPELNPDLIIVSLGTNEAVDHPFIEKNFPDDVSTFMKELTRRNPGIPILLTTPIDFYKKKTKRNPGVEIVREVLLKEAAAKNLAVLDCYEVAGGKHSADKWRKFGLMQKDGIHSTKLGYDLQGVLIYRALMNSYRNYVQHRHP